jgi:hypothetical protein
MQENTGGSPAGAALYSGDGEGIGETVDGSPELATR